MAKETILVTGGAGYIGGTTALCLQEAGYQVAIIDNLSTGFTETLTALDAPVYRGDIGDAALVQKAVRETKPAAVIHFAAHAYVGESVKEPAKYYLNNTAQSMQFFATLAQSGVKNVVFSSTCATYGVAKPPISETTPQNPINPYGHSKLMVEQVLKDYGLAYDLNWIAFRYFNVVGCHPSLKVGERHNPETHLLPRALFAALGSTPLEVYGQDYPTPDGSCIRDYVHVADIAQAHILGVQYLLKGGSSQAVNIGTGKGTSVLEIIKEVEKVSGKTVPWKAFPRRAGDPPELVAAAARIKTLLGWEPRYSDLNTIIKTAWDWYQQHPEIIC